MSNQIITSELLKDDPELLGLIDRFLSRLPNMQAEIIRAYDHQERDIFTSLIHQMKGVGGNYGYPTLTILCSEIEDNLKSEMLIELKQQLLYFNLLVEDILAGSDENHKIVEQSS